MSVDNPAGLAAKRVLWGGIALDPRIGEYVYMSNDKSKGGRPPAPPGLRRVNVPLRLPEWLVQWMAEQPETPAELIEAALLKAHKLRPPRAA
jgi:hypothetical protein